VSPRLPPTSPPRLLANTAWNLAGQVVPMLVGLAALPLLIRWLGLDRFGFLTLVWVLVGYASIFDFGLARVLIRVVAARLARGDAEGARHIGRVGISCLGLFGLLAGSVFALATPWLVQHVFKLPPGMEDESLRAMWLLAASLPFVMLTSGYAGVLEAHQAFRGLNLLRAAIGIASYAGPVLVAAWVPRVDALVCFSLALRAFTTLAYDALARRDTGFAFRPLWPDAASARELFRLSGWVGVSNIVSPLLSYLDRLLLGALVPVRAVAFYATPYDLVGRSMVLPQALMATLFPTAAGVLPGSDAARDLLLRTARQLFVLTLPVVFALSALARPGLRLWLGEDFAVQAVPVLQLLALGVLFNMLAQAPAMLIQAAGQPRVMALLHLVELPLFVALLWALTLHWGIVGTALAAVLRNGLDGLAVLWLARRDVARGALPWRAAVAPVALTTLLLGAAALPVSAWGTLALLAAGLPAFALNAWHRLLRPHERLRLRRLLARKP
jgi:O-antigen/teichoic acid export membrane protein